MEVFVTGGTGYVGQPVVTALLAAGHRVRLLTRRMPAPWPATSWLSPIPGTLTDQEALREGTSGAHAVVHLVGIIRQDLSSGTTFAAVHSEGTRRLLEVAAGAGVRRWLQMSALGVDPRSPSAYFRTKAEAEAAVRASGLDWTIFRPSLVFGPGGPGAQFLSEIRDRLLTLPLHPMIDGGHQRLQPVAVGTVAEAFARALDAPSTIGATYDLAGPEVLTFRQMVNAVAQALGRPFRPVWVPSWLVQAMLPVLDRSGRFPLTRDQLLMLRAGNTSDTWQEAYQALALNPVGFSAEGL